MLLPGEILQAQEVDIFEKKCVVTTNCKKSAEVIVLGGEKTEEGPNNRKSQVSERRRSIR